MTKHEKLLQEISTLEKAAEAAFPVRWFYQPDSEFRYIPLSGSLSLDEVNARQGEYVDVTQPDYILALCKEVRAALLCEDTE